MTDRPLAAGILVTGVRARRRVAKAQRLRHVAGAALNRPGEAAVADAHELAVPLVRGRQPDLHVDQRVRGWLEHELDTAVRGNRGWRCRCTATAWTGCRRAAALWTIGGATSAGALAVATPSTRRGPAASTSAAASCCGRRRGPFGNQLGARNRCLVELQ